jgi:cytochrome c-type biogenesis protein CcmH/NrfG
MDTHMPALLEEPLYFADGQIRDEVYVYGSFLQSKMHAKGVTCGDCHDPHTLEVKYGGGNQLCNQCHLAEKFDSPEHHRHAPDSSGARCVECHMPERTYMVVDPRRDHSLRIPRPDLSQLLGAPNACNRCHTDRDASWAAGAIAEWTGRDRPAELHWAPLLAAARAGVPGLDAALGGLIANREVPAIVRATAVGLLRGRPDRSALPVLAGALSDEAPLVRSAAVEVLDSARDEVRLPLGGLVLDDPVRAVRIGAGRVLAGVPAGRLSADQKPLIERALAEYVTAQNVNADRAEAHVNLAGLYVDRGEPERAEAAYRRAIAIEPTFVGAYVNLADLYRSLERDAEGEQVLRQAFERAPDDAGVRHSLGLVLVRLGRVPEALLSLQRAADLAPGNPRYAYVYAVALRSEDRARATPALEETHARHPGDREVLQTLALYLEEDGEIDKAIGYARKLLDLDPEDRGAQGLLERLLENH